MGERSVRRGSARINDCIAPALAPGVLLNIAGVVRLLELGILCLTFLLGGLFRHRSVIEYNAQFAAAAGIAISGCWIVGAHVFLAPEPLEKLLGLGAAIVIPFTSATLFFALPRAMNIQSEDQVGRATAFIAMLTFYQFAATLRAHQILRGLSQRLGGDRPAWDNRGRGVQLALAAGTLGLGALAASYLIAPAATVRAVIESLRAIAMPDIYVAWYWWHFLVVDRCTALAIPLIVLAVLLVGPRPRAAASERQG
jgi:hypothetical protein